MTTPSNNQGASKQTETLSSKPSFLRRFLLLFALIVIGCVFAVSAVLIMPSRWSPWLERELSEQTGLDISWERFSWRGFGGFQITAIDIRDPDGTLALTIPKLPFRWSLGLSQKPSLRIDSVEIVDIQFDYRNMELREDGEDELSPTEPPRTPEEYEALFQAKLIEIRSLASLLDSLPLSLIIKESRVHLARFTYEDSSTALSCNDLSVSLDALVSPKVARRRALLEIQLPRTCGSTGGQLNSTGGMKVLANSDNIQIETKVKIEALTNDEESLNANLDLGMELATSLNVLKFNVNEVKLEPFFNLEGALLANLRAPATLSFTPWSLTFKRDGLPSQIANFLRSQKINFRSGELKLDMTAEDVPFAELLSEPLQALNLKSDLRVNELGFNFDVLALRGVDATLVAHLEGGRLTTEHQTRIAYLREETSQAVARGLQFSGADDLLLTVFHGENTEVLLPGSYRFYLRELVTPEVRLEGLALALKPQLGIRGLDPLWVLAQPKIQVDRILTPQAELTSIESKVELRHAVTAADTRLQASWNLSKLGLFRLVEDIAKSDLSKLSGSVALRWQGRRELLSISSFEQHFADWASFRARNLSIDLKPNLGMVVEGQFDGWWKEVPGFVHELLATSGLSVQSSGQTDWRWRGTLPPLPEFPESACYLDHLTQVVRPEVPKFSLQGNLELDGIELKDDANLVQNAVARIEVDYQSNDFLKVQLNSRAGGIQSPDLNLTDVIFEAGASLTPEALGTQHSYTLGSLLQANDEILKGHVGSGTMEYRFATSQIDGEVSLTNRFPAANILARFAGESFGNWFCNGGVLDGALLGLPNLTSSVDVRIGEAGQVLELGERQLHGKVTMKSQVTIQEKQVDLVGDIAFGNNEIRDPEFHARGVNGVLPINQQLLFRTQSSSCLELSSLPSGFCLIVDGREAVKAGIHRDPTIRIAGLTSQDLTISRMSAEASYSAGWFGLRDYSAELLDGDLRGDIYFGVTSKRGFDSRFSLKVSDLQLSRLLPKRFRKGKRTRANLVFDAGLMLSPGVSDLSLDLAVTRLEPDALDALLNAMEQKTGLAQVSQARDNLGWIDFRSMTVWIRHEGLNVELDYDPIVIGYRPIPRSLMKRYSLRDWIFEPIIEAEMVPILGEFLDWERENAL